MTSWKLADPMVRDHCRLVCDLAIDLERIRKGSGPSTAEIASAPLIDGWYVGVRPEPALIGSVAGHPHVEGRVVTSQLHFIDPDLGYARTLSRLYRLGQEIC